MQTTRINTMSGRVMMGLAFVALLMVAIGYAIGPQPPQADENSEAHIFQLSIALLFPAALVFLATADWRQRARSIVPLVISIAMVAVAFVGLYRLEHP